MSELFERKTALNKLLSDENDILVLRVDRKEIRLSI
jgi:hypothetical protein